MTLLSTLSDASHHSFTEQLIALPLPTSADLFDVADLCVAFASALVETQGVSERHVLCGRLLHALEALERLCDDYLPPHLIEQLIAGDAAPLAGDDHPGHICPCDGAGDSGEYAAAGGEPRADGITP